MASFARRLRLASTLDSLVLEHLALARQNRELVAAVRAYATCGLGALEQAYSGGLQQPKSCGQQRGTAIGHSPLSTRQ